MFDRSQLPDPANYFKSEGLRLKGARHANWKTTECRFHGGSDSMRVNVATGAFRCMNCQASGGDVLAYHMQAIMAFCHVLAIRIFFEHDIHTLTHEDGRRDAVLLGSLALVLSIETINDITHIIYRDDTLILRETHIISLRLVLQVIEPKNITEILHVAAEVYVILYEDTIA